MAIATVAGYDADDEAQGAAVVGDQQNASPLISPRQAGCASITGGVSPCSCSDNTAGGTVDIGCSYIGFDNAGLKALTAKIPPTTPIEGFDFGNNASFHLF